MKNISLAMLARRIGVGVATVDQVLNGRGGVSPQTTTHQKKCCRRRANGTEADPAGGHRFPPADWGLSQQQ